MSFFTKDYVPQLRKTRDNRTNKIYSAISFITMQLPCFNVFKDMFYVSNIKIVSSNIYKLLTPKELVFWIMDDGSRHGLGLHLSVYAFLKEDVCKLMFVLQDKFNFKCLIHNNRDNKPHIYI